MKDYSYTEECIERCALVGLVGEETTPFECYLLGAFLPDADTLREMTAREREDAREQAKRKYRNQFARDPR